MVLRNIFMQNICLVVSMFFLHSLQQGVGVAKSRRFLGGVGFLTTLGVGVGFFCPTPDVRLDHFLHHTPKLGIPFEMVHFVLKLLLKQRLSPVHHGFH